MRTRQDKANGRRWRTVVLSLLFCISMPVGAGLGGQPAPDFALPDAAGANQRLSEFRGDVVLVSFWASWCGRCQQQLEQLSALQQQHGDGLHVLTVNIERDPRAAHELSRRLNLVVLHDAEQDVSRLYDPGKLPMTLLVDAHGQIRHVHENYRGGDELVYERELRVLLDER